MSKKRSLYLFKSRRINKHEKQSRLIILREKKPIFSSKKVLFTHTFVYNLRIKNMHARVLLTCETIERLSTFATL